MNPNEKSPVQSLKYPVMGAPVKAPIYPIEMMAPAARPTFSCLTSSTGRERRRANIPPKVIPRMGDINQIEDGLSDTAVEEIANNKKLEIMMSLLLPVRSDSMGTSSTAGISRNDMTEVAVAAKTGSHPRSVKYVGSQPMVE
jgi:hypothetical protein